ncbi:MAG TPA: DUF2149 domain-containing protein [Thermoleophilia bacterium]|nr:DUF2149 domain-containing protein [Thermoleophilia bacterium]HQG02709.1 DUF2149 domain-containing protein [Thermoleophilia bacterium]HQJ97118.1 DUF2149 domain-containing protein [Thermoleophilia bacterium]
MTYEDDDSEIRFLPTVLEEPGAGMGLRYMKRRRTVREDRNGDPLDGVINLFDVAIVLAVGFLLSALTGLGMTDVLTGGDMTVVTNPGTDKMQMIVKSGETIERFDVEAGEQVTGVGTLIGSFYRLSDGSTVYVPAAEAAPAGATPLPEATASPTPAATPTAPAMPAPGQTGPATGTGGESGATGGESGAAGSTVGAPAAAPAVQPGKKGG